MNKYIYWAIAAAAAWYYWKNRKPKTAGQVSEDKGSTAEGYMSDEYEIWAK